MASYAKGYRDEMAAHAKTRQKLAHAEHFIQSFRSFVRAKNLHQDFLEWALSHFLGEAEAMKMLAELEAEKSKPKDTGSVT